VRLLDTRGAAASGRKPATTSNPAARAAVFSGCAVVLCGILLLSPLFRVTTVVWTGSVALAAQRCESIESSSLGESLLVLPHKRLQGATDPAGRLQIQFKKHFPNTLEVSVDSRLAVACSDRGEALDASGHVLGSAHADPSLPKLHGFVVTDGQLGVAGVRVLRALQPLLALPGLRPSDVERDGDDVVLTLARSATRVRVRLAALDAQLTKLRVYEQSLGTGELPGALDLRFRQQVVIGTGAGGTHADG